MFDFIDFMALRLLHFPLFALGEDGGTILDKLTIPLTSITESGLPVDVTVGAEALRPPGVAEFPLSDVRVRGTFQALGGEYLFRGTVTGKHEHPCDRCLTDMATPFELDVAWLYQPGTPTHALEDAPLEEAEAESTDEDFFFFEGNEIDLAPRVWEETLLSAPTKFLCKPDCQGLCPRCGANRNRESCGCPSEDEPRKPGIRGLEKLREQFPDVFPENMED